jgi:hypothetical protein
MGILMAICALFMRNRLAEVSSLMAFVAIHLRVLPVQRELTRGVFEAAAWVIVFPSVRVVTPLACRSRCGAYLPERASVWIGVAGLAAICSDTSISALRLTGAGTMALLALRVFMLAREWKRCLRVVEPRGGLPCVLHMASGAFGAQLPPMLILVAG